MLEKLNFRTLKFSGTLTFIISITSLAYSSYYTTGEYVTFLRVGLLTDLYFLIALASERMGDQQNLFSHVYDIYHTPMDDTDKIMQIREFLENATTRWAKLWRMYQEIVKERKFHLRRVSEKAQQIYRGEIGFNQFLWIMGNFAYSLMIAEDMIDIPTPIDVLAVLLILGIILFSSGKVSGLGETFAKLFQSLKFKNKNEIRSLLDLIEKICKDALKYYYAVTLKIEEKQK